MTTPEPCTNWYGTRRHYSTDLAEDRNYAPGRTGHSLCSSDGNPVDVYDQAAQDRVSERFWSKRVLVADLPPCKKCARRLP